MVDKNLFPYNLAVAAIFKEEAPYLREWLDYHLLAGVEHFYLYNNDSSDDYEKILAPYIEANLVTLIDWSGKAMQNPAYLDALNRFRFFCRYMTFIDLDEFIFPKTNQSIVEVADEVLSRNNRAQALAIRWRIFGSNGQKTADYSRGVLERFTRRAPDEDETSEPYVKIVGNPRSMKFFAGSHFATHFGGNFTVDEFGNKVTTYRTAGTLVEKIVLNHYAAKSFEEFSRKDRRGFADNANVRPYTKELFNSLDLNEVFDEDILIYRNVRIENFSLENDEQRIRRVEKFLIDTLTQQSPFDVPAEFFTDKLETFLTCRKLAEVFGTRIGNKTAEEYALVWIYQSFVTRHPFNYAELQLLLNELPALLKRPFPLCRKILRLVDEKLFPLIDESLKQAQNWGGLYYMNFTRQILNSILR
ncbi:MAG: glycosyltransferase family 92 protein [Selenomonadaceae bacterium]|nr:glycosyltransferase family 92 protein [Selenomonadaceae bacterium]